ncbi:MAG: hypothetical protein ACKOTD_04890, partial [Phycisphaerales bacterium]
MNCAGVIATIDAIGVPPRRAATVRATVCRAGGGNALDPSSDSSERSVCDARPTCTPIAGGGPRRAL